MPFLKKTSFAIDGIKDTFAEKHEKSSTASAFFIPNCIFFIF